MIKLNKKGYYTCPYDCHDKRFPRPKWKTEKGYLNHLDKCPKNPEVIKKKQEQEKEIFEKLQEEYREEIEKCIFKKGEEIWVSTYTVTAPTRDRNGRRLRYEEERYYSVVKTVVENITASFSGILINNRYFIGDVFRDRKEAEEKNEREDKKYKEHVKQCQMYR